MSYSSCFGALLLTGVLALSFSGMVGCGDAIRGDDTISAPFLVSRAALVSSLNRSGLSVKYAHDNPYKAFRSSGIDSVLTGTAADRQGNKVKFEFILFKPDVDPVVPNLHINSYQYRDGIKGPRDLTSRDFRGAIGNVGYVMMSNTYLSNYDSKLSNALNRVKLKLDAALLSLFPKDDASVYPLSDRP